MTEAQRISVHILDREYLVACPKGQEKKLLESASLLHQKMKDIRDSGRVLGIERIAVMAALNVTHELLEASPSSQQDEQSVQHMIDKLDQVLKDNQGLCFDF